MKTVTITDESGAVIRTFQINDVSELNFRKQGRTPSNLYTVHNPEGTKAEHLTSVDVANHCMSPLSTVRVMLYSIKPGQSFRYKIWTIERE